MTRKRTSLYAVFTGMGIPVFGAYSFSAKELAAHHSALQSVGGGKGEHIVRITVQKYNAICTARGWPEVRA